MRAAALLLATACAGGSLPEGTLSLSAPDGVVIDPKLSGDPALSLALTLGEAGVSCETSTRVENEIGQVATLGSGVALTWDGRDDDGLAFDPGLARATASCDGEDVASLDLHVLRVGVLTVDFTAGPDSGNVPLAWHKRTLLDREVSALPEVVPEYIGHVADAYTLSLLDGEDGSPRVGPEPWPDAALPPWGELEPGEVAQSAPAAYVAGTRPGLSVTGAFTAVSQRSHTAVAANPEGLPLRLTLDGYSPDDGEGAWVEGSALTLRADEALAGTLGREQLTLSWRWQVQVDGAWQDLPGLQETRHDLWRLAGPTALRDGTTLGFAPAITWVGALAELEDDLEAVPAEPDLVLDAIRDHLNQDRWLVYNPNDASYSSYSGSYITWDYIWSDLGIWLDRTQGIELYCHSVSCLLSVLSGHWGVEAPQQVLGIGFNTNYTRAAGTESWQKWSFNSHSVVSPDDGQTIWDASIDLDGDGSPGSSPNEALAPKGLSQQEYLELLTPDEIEIVNSGLCYFQ